MIGWLVAAQIAIVAQGPGVASSCAPFEVTVAARAAGASAPRLSFPEGGAFQLLRRTSTSRVEPDPSGTPFAVTEATFLVATRAAGRVAITGISAAVGARRVVATPVPILVSPAGDEDDPTVLVRAVLDDGRARGDLDTLFVGQQVDYVVQVQLNEAARRRLRRNPTFFPPDMPAVLAYDVAPPGAVARTGQHCFENLTYRRALFPLFPGPTVIPPASLTYALPVSTSFFSREESHEVRTDSVRMIALEPPLAGRPADFAGAVGVLKASARLGSASGRMGDPLVLTLRLEGEGNVKLLPRPVVTVPWAAIAIGEERVEVDTAHARVSGAKEFDWLLTPRVAGREEIPAIRYPYFDPEHASYELAVTTTIGLDIAPASLALADTATTPRLGIRTTLHEEHGAPLTDRPAYWLLLALAPIPATLRRTRRVRRRGASGRSAVKRLQHAASASSPVLARELRRLFLDALRERVPALGPATARSPLARQLRRAGVTDATAAAAESLLEVLDTAAFSGGGALDAARSADAVRLAREVDEQAVRPAPRSREALLLVVLLAGGLSALALPTGVERTFADGVRAYRSGNFVLAERQFARAAARAPRAGDAWANFGAAAWAANDTGRAAAGWQRALRLDPLDVETRERLDVIHPATTMGERGFVPPLPVDGVAAFALAIWVAAWLALALPPTRRPAWIRPVAGGAIVVALVAFAAALELRDRAEPRGLAVLRRSEPLLDTPTPAGAAAGSAGIGEVALLGAREGSWVRVTFDNARAGWVPTSAMLPLESAASD